MTGQIFRTTANVCGTFCLALAIAMLLPMAIDLHDGNPDWQVFLNSSLFVSVFSALAIVATRGAIAPFSLRLGFFLINCLWLSTSVVAAIPYLMSSLGMSLADSVFEAVSGLTTTGSTVLTGLDGMPRGLLVWRSLTQWIGGFGIIAMGMLLLPFLRVGGMQIYQMESSTKGESPTARFKEFAMALVGIYVTFTLACAACYLAAGMSEFDALNHAMTTLSTGGFSTHDRSLGYFGEPILAVAIVFMLAGALPFIALVRALVLRDARRALEPQIPVLLGILVVLSALVAAGLIIGGDGPPGWVTLHATFNIVSVVTTTGYASADYMTWGTHAVGLFMLATFLGGCAGSTSGGLKTYRLVVMYQTVRSALRGLVFPNGLFVVRYGGEVVPPESIRSITVFIGAFFAALVTIAALLALMGLDYVTAFSGALTALTNTGPGLGDVIGPADNFASLPDAAKWLLSVAMLLGRLEILTVLVVFSPVFWRR